MLLVDCDAMFCAVARLVDPEGAGRARVLIVGGRRGPRGVVCSASYEARARGVHSGMPITRAERLCPGAVFAPVPRGACGRKSREVRAVLEDWSPVVEAASIDEYYLSLEGTEALYRGEPLEETAGRIRADVLARTGLPVSIGGGSNRLIAKLAAGRAKPVPSGAGTGVHIVPPGSEGPFVAALDLADLPGVGPRLAATLGARGLVRVQDALALERAELEQWLGPRTGGWLFQRMRGLGRTTLIPRGTPKSVSHETTFGVDLVADEAIARELLRLATRVGADLRHAGLAARTITVKIRDQDFRTRSAARTLRIPVRTDGAVLPVARSLLAGLRRERRVPARLLGIALSGFRHAEQLELFARQGVESEHDRRVASMVDRIRGRFGADAIGPAGLVPPANSGERDARRGEPRSP